MRRNFLCSALLLAVFLAGGSCNLAEGPEYGRGTLTLLLPDSAGRSVISDAERAGLIYNFSFTGPGETQTVEAVGSGATITLEAGEWTVEAQAFKPGRTAAVGSGRTKITVIAGRNISLGIPMKLDPAYEGTLRKIYIHNEEDLRRVAAGDFDISGGIEFYLERDIVLTRPWTPIGDNNAPFKAEFNGRGHSVTVRSFAPAKKAGNEVSLGFFAYTDGGAIKNITVKYELDGVVDIRTDDGGTYYDSYAGGLAGWARGARFEKARVTGDFSVIADGNSSLSVGGIVGYGNEITIADCRAAGNFGGNSTNALFIGGVAGMATSPSTPPVGRISGTSFTGNISAYAAAGNCEAGGIAGNSRLEITACFVEGRVRAEADAPRVGGIVGSNTHSITNSYALGVIEGVGVSATTAGGIAGVGWSSSIIENCYAVAHVSSRSGSSGVLPGFFNSAGGIVGDLYEGTISKCYAAGTVKVDGAVPSYGGGIVGEARLDVPPGTPPLITGSMALVSELDGGQIGSSNKTVHLIGDGTAGWFTSNYVRDDLRPSHYTNPLTPNDSRDGTSRPPADFESPSLYAASGVNWDFSNTWKWIDGYNYPVLAWQSSPPEFPAIPQ